MVIKHTLDIIFAIDEAMASGQNGEAEAHCRRLIGRGHVEIDVLSRLSVALARQCKQDEAARWFRLAVLWDPSAPEASGNLVHAREIADDAAAACATFRWLRCLVPDNLDFAERHGDVAVRTGRLEEAFGAYQVAFSGGTSNPKQSYKLFDTLRLLRQGAKAPVFFSAASPLRIALVTAADEGYAPYLRGLIASFLERAGRFPPRICVLDLGLGADTRAWLDTLDAIVVQPGWDLAFPDRDHAPETFKALTARPFLPAHFPSFDLYLWMDADTWVQDARWLDDFLLSALLGRLAVVPEMSPSYLRQYRTFADNGKRVDEQTWRRRAYALCFDEATADSLADRPTLNSGVFALRSDAPHWHAWQQSLEIALQRIRYPLVEQTAFNHAVYKNRLLTAPMAAAANWQVHRRLPFIDPRTGKLCEPFPPHDPLGIIHVTGPEKTRRHTLLRLDGVQVSRTLLYQAEN